MRQGRSPRIQTLFEKNNKPKKSKPTEKIEKKHRMVRLNSKTFISIPEESDEKEEIEKFREKLKKHGAIIQ